MIHALMMLAAVAVVSPDGMVRGELCVNGVRPHGSQWGQPPWKPELGKPLGLPSASCLRNLEKRTSPNQDETWRERRAARQQAYNSKGKRG